jgi:hypothetical protein
MAQKGFEDAGNVVLKQDVPDAGGTHDDLARFVKFDFIERILEGEIIADLVPIPYHLSVPHDRADVIEGRQGLLHLEPSQEQPQTALEPGQGAAGEFFKGPMVGVGLFLGFFSSGVG